VVERNINKTGVHRGQHHILMYLYHNPKRSQKQIADSLDISTATVAVSIKKLEKNGYIARLTNEEDNRFNVVELSEKGIDIVRKSFDIFHLIDSTMLEDFSEDEVEIFIGYLEKLHTKLTKLTEVELITEDEFKRL
jgi:DNA-binding MarR family transcriptional regulator